MYAGGLNVVMGKIFHHTPSTIVRITLVSLAVAAERVRFLAEREEIEVDDLPPPTIRQRLQRLRPASLVTPMVTSCAACA
jgi:hypothetical protein